MTLTLTHFLVLSALLLGVGVLTMALKRSPLGILMGAQLVAAAAALNFVAFNAYSPDTYGAAPSTAHVGGPMFALFILLVTALQAALALALFLNLAGHSGPAPETPPVTYPSE